MLESALQENQTSFGPKPARTVHRGLVRDPPNTHIAVLGQEPTRTGNPPQELRTDNDMMKVAFFILKNGLLSKLSNITPFIVLLFVNVVIC